jgi:hypothetical protein
MTKIRQQKKFRLGGEVVHRLLRGLFRSARWQTVNNFG